MPGSAQAAKPTCQGLEATIVSSARVINGTSGVDVIVVQGSGDHSVNSGSGNDVICGSSGNDRINSGAGDDKVNSAAGNDRINGGTGDDSLTGGAGSDVILAASGDDNVSGGVGNDTIQGNSGSDTVAGGAGNDSVQGGAGEDRLNGDTGTDSLAGDAGSDTLTGGSGNDSVQGGDGADRLDGHTGTDSLAGGAGDDTLQGGAGKDSLNPGAGTNYCATDAADSMIGSCTIDNSGPEMSNVSVPSSVQAGSAVTFIWSVNEAAGVDSSWVKIGGPSGWVTTWCGFGIQGTRISGTAQAAVFSATCQVPENAVNTEYTAFFDAADVFGLNAQSLSANFRVIGGASDASAPVVTQLAVSSPTLAYGETLDITFSVEDETGMQGVIAWIAHNGYGFANNQGRSHIDYGTYAVTLTSGDAKNGTYLQRIGLNEWAPSGEYTLWISVIDTLGNKVFYQTDTKFTVN
jgi:hypothetical protein